MKVILKKVNANFPFDWANLTNYRKSSAYRKEIYLKDYNNVVKDLLFLFHCLFEYSKDRLLVYDESWGDFCLDTWNINEDKYNYSLEGKTAESQAYLKMLEESQINLNYSGSCICMDWDKFLVVILKCVVNNIAPYSPIFCDIENEYFFYFHSTGSIGIYYKKENDTMKEILSKANFMYIVEE